MRENHPKHRRFRKEQRKLERRRAERARFPAVLIVCEGRETEPNYIRGLCESYRINLANVKIHAGTDATDSVALVKRARQLFEVDRDFDHVYVVCDDCGEFSAKAFEEAQKPLRRIDGKRIYVNVVRSSPCFEFWLLMHFEYSTKPYTNADEAIDDLKGHLPDYRKSDPLIFRKVSAGFELAIERARQVKAELQTTGAAIPYTDMSDLAEQLLLMRRQ